MARPLLLRPPITSMPQAGLAAAMLLLCAIALFMCASHSHKWRRWKAYYNSRYGDPVIQLNTEAMSMATGRVCERSSVSGELGDVPVWQKNILMGDKCQLPDFSGLIMYDSAGNIMAPAKNSVRLLTWK